MQAVRTIIWVLIAVMLVVFTMNNWQPVDIMIAPGYVLETKLPILVLIAVLIGALPFWMKLLTTRWRTKRQIDSLDRELTTLKSPGSIKGASTAVKTSQTVRTASGKPGSIADSAPSSRPKPKLP